MITRHHESDGRQSTAVYSDCERYRYSLTREWDVEGKRLLYVMLNPSKATERDNDPTIERCERRAKRLNYGAFGVVNLFALRETSPANLRRAKWPEGPENTAQIAEMAGWADEVLCAWGVHGEHLDQCDSVLPILRESGKPLLSLGLTKAGHPRHPLYISYEILPEPWL